MGLGPFWAFCIYKWPKLYVIIILLLMDKEKKITIIMDKKEIWVDINIDG